MGDVRVEFTSKIAAAYGEGESIRAISAQTGRSYGFVHRVLLEGGVELRQSGGATRKRKPS